MTEITGTEIENALSRAAHHLPSDIFLGICRAIRSLQAQLEAARTTPLALTEEQEREVCFVMEYDGHEYPDGTQDMKPVLESLHARGYTISFTGNPTLPGGE